MCQIPALLLSECPHLGVLLLVSGTLEGLATDLQRTPHNLSSDVCHVLDGGSEQPSLHQPLLLSMPRYMMLFFQLPSTSHVSAACSY